MTEDFAVTALSVGVCLGFVGLGFVPSKHQPNVPFRDRLPMLGLMCSIALLLGIVLFTIRP